VAAGGDLRVSRAAHTATLLDDGRVLIAGGCTEPGCEGNAAGVISEFFEPATDAFVLGPEMTGSRAGHTATLLAGGPVLIAGGYSGGGSAPLASAEVFDPATGAFTATGSMAEPRGAHTATVLADGRVLVVGGVSGRGRYLDAVEMYDPATGEFTLVAPMPSPRSTHAAVALADGRVLVVGGEADVEGVVLATADLYNPASDRWSAAAELVDARYKHAVVAVPGGPVLAIGGADETDFDGRLASIEAWDPATGDWRTVTNLERARFKISDAIALVPDGRVLVAGDGLVPEVVDPNTFEVVQVDGRLAAAVLFTTATALDDGRVLIAGGYDGDITVRAETYLYIP